LVVLVSGAGTNLQALLDACAAGRLDAQVVAVVSNRGDAGGLERARAAGVPAVALPVGGRERRDYDRDLATAVAAHHPDLVVLAGWMRILTSDFLDRFPAKVLNLHPAPPGRFPGVGAIEAGWRAWQAGEVTEWGVMVHLVPDEQVDAGPVVAWRPVPFEAGDTLDSFEARVHAVEHDLLVEAVGSVLSAAGTLGGDDEEAV
jgi:formyltetrahydrofolate-dependent phosphoribosylglycinamide formyltransferase